ncbi:sugar phosphate isomerase/epimerase family protein [Pseudarthrobacter sp. PH31-O2]|uniref:sugar phosphate isomerase/epimerase family protein n=1 Tax=Pseudarthrobacter sp. PH31-O2 TaxID=3046206 RepID=UPI0024B8EA56|nr:sugar phosphate isomerase/epimerase family protein [Pseudarthrobacter sp. PH31-O2]MDJ0354016.1 sugar phosphate isomerase/epimerase family protein [Pseudarthrobacter sp. PH31-O2]
MKIGFSSFSFSDKMLTGKMSIVDVIEWIGRSDGEHLELATVSFSPKGTDTVWSFGDDPDLIEAIRSSAATNGVELSGMCIPADFIGEPDDRAAQIERVKDHIRLSDSLGIRYFRHDVTQWARKIRDVSDFEENFATIVDASAEIARFAAKYGIQTSVENHGFYMNGSEHVRRLIAAVNESNFKTTLDVGNFLCVDEDPLIATKANLPQASFVHLKDFYIRPHGSYPGEGWLTTTGGSYLLGSIVGFGDMDTRGILSTVVAGGYDGYISIEFEGNEDCLFACETGLTNVKRILEELR